VAQKSELIRVEKDFEAKVAKLNKEKKNLEQTLAEANQAIQESQEVLAQQKSEVAELVRARAQMKSDLRSLREEKLTQLRGELDTESHRLQRLEHSVEDLIQGVKILEGDMKTGDQVRAKEIATLRENVKKDFAQQNTTMSENLAGLRASLIEFKKTMAAIDRRLVGEQTRSTAAETNIRNDFEAQQAALQIKLDSDTQTLKQYLETSIRSVVKTLENVNETLGAQLDAHAVDLGSQRQLLSDLNVKVGTELVSLKQQDKGTHQNFENLAKSMVELRVGLDKVGKQLGSEVDEHAQSLKQSDGRLQQAESQVAALSKKLDSDTQSLRGYLDKDIRVSLRSLARELEFAKTRGMESSKKLEGLVQTMDKASQVDLKQTKAKMALQDQRLESLGQSVTSMREVLDSMAAMLGKRSDDQMQRVGKLLAQLEQVKQGQSSVFSQQDTNIQALSTHVKEVTGSVQSAVKSLNQIKTALTSRLDQQNMRLEEQDQRLTEATRSSVSSGKVNQELAANVQDMNQLKEALKQLKNVVNAIGGKLGGKIDEHESQLARLKKQMQQASRSLNILLKRLKPLLQAPGLQ